ncbi:MAG: M1 family metallopeptidase [Deltaproteobacteria bacterium]|nr:M1 family metallopeptidase [Deltaproteobacteria bacterium]
MRSKLRLPRTSHFVVIRLMRKDPHSFADDTQPTTRSVELDLVVDFEQRRVRGTALLRLDRDADGVLDLDTRGLQIHTASGRDGQIRFELAAEEGFVGRRLRLFLHGDFVRIEFVSSNEATALQWLSEEMTAGRSAPFMFTQCQAIHARSIFPCQDTPRARITYSARLDVPEGLVAVMAAKSLEDAPGATGRRIFTFEMTQPIPSYLFAFAVGHLGFRDLGPRSRVYAEPEMLGAAAFEFADVESMIEKAESLFGKYVWERFDMLLMPPSFPYGGMENPRLTFLTPTLLTGDRTLVNVVAHELAHSWTGNLVTNESMNDFWLNEGFTTYAERRILETLEGTAQATLHAALGLDMLRRDLARFGESSPFTRLQLDLAGVDPDEVYSSVAYEKGYLFLRRIEAAMGRPAFDRMLLSYIATYPFKSIPTAEFVAFLEKAVPNIGSLIDVSEWLTSPGLPNDAPLPDSPRLSELRATADRAGRGESIDVRSWTALDLQVFVASLPKSMPEPIASALDAALSLTKAKNPEIRIPWLAIAIKSGVGGLEPTLRKDLLEIGRMKYLRPLYGALVDSGRKELALEIFETAKSHYHPVARAMVERTLSTAA